jgi:hypothetical protein
MSAQGYDLRRSVFKPIAALAPFVNQLSYHPIIFKK